jgi:hypothetical protein
MLDEYESIIQQQYPIFIPEENQQIFSQQVKREFLILLFKNKMCTKAYAFLYFSNKLKRFIHSACPGWAAARLRPTPPGGFAK